MSGRRSYSSKPGVGIYRTQVDGRAAMRVIAHHAQIVGHQQNRHVVFPVDAADQLVKLLLILEVDARSRLVRGDLLCSFLPAVPWPYMKSAVSLGENEKFRFAFSAGHQEH